MDATARQCGWLDGPAHCSQSSVRVPEVVPTASRRAAIVQPKSSYDVKGIILSDSLRASCEAITVQRIPCVVGVLFDPFFVKSALNLN